MGLGGAAPAYSTRAARSRARVPAAAAMSPQPPIGSTDEGPREPVLRSIAEGLRFVRRNNALLGSFAIDLLAMTFGMPRALFAVLAVSVYGAGAEGTGLLYAAVAAGAAAAPLPARLLGHAPRRGGRTHCAGAVPG